MLDRLPVCFAIPATRSLWIVRPSRRSFWQGFRSSFLISSVSIVFAIAGSAVPVFSHNVKTDADIGATFHIEPNHNPRAGETARAWFALTRQGGELIPLDQCNCQLAVYDRATSDTEPILTPPLQAIAAEEFQDIPGADLVFPQAGVYELEITGSPKDGESFSPFSLTYNVTVTPGTTPAASPASETNPTPATPSSSPDSTPSWKVPIVAIAFLLVAGGGWWALKQVKSKES